jgi:integrase
MSRKLPKYVNGFIDRHGKSRYQLRLPGRKKISLQGLPWSEEFMAAYTAALNAAPTVPPIGLSRSVPGTVAEAVARYLDSSNSFGLLSPSTQAMRRRILNQFRDQHGDKRIRGMKLENVTRIIGVLRPWVQRNWMKSLRGLMKFAVKEGLVDVDPTADVELATVKDTGGHPPWTPEQIEQYREHHPLGTMPRLALEIGLGTIARRGDAVKLGRQHIRNGILSMKQGKTGNQVDIPVLHELQAAIDAMGKEHMTFLVTHFGAAFTDAGFGNAFRDWCNAAGIKNRSFHGLRKTGATRLADAGATDHEIMAWGGWTSLSEVQRYTRQTNRKRAAIEAAKKLKTFAEQN